MGTLEDSIDLIREFEPQALKADPRGYNVCSSFGKDSMALLEVFKMAGVKFHVQYNVTGIDPPELVYFARKQMDKLRADGIPVFEVKPRMSMQKMITKKGPPTRLSRFCCEELKERSVQETAGMWHSFGVRKVESSNRAKRESLEFVGKKKADAIKLNTFDNQLFLFSDNGNKRRMIETCTKKGVRAVNPIVMWSDETLWDFTRGNGIPYCSLYDEGFKRLGCVGCPMAGKGRTHEFERWPGFVKYYKNAFRKFLDKNRAAAGRHKWNTVDLLWAWWMEETEDNALDNYSFFDEG